MTTEKKNIDILIKKGLEGAVKSPPPYVWDKISASLNTVKSGRKLLIYWLAAASFTLLIGFSAGYYLAMKKNTGINNIENIAKNNNDNQEIINKQASQAADISDNNQEHSQNTKTDKKEIALINKPESKTKKFTLSPTKTEKSPISIQALNISTPKAIEKSAVLPLIADIPNQQLAFHADLYYPESGIQPQNNNEKPHQKRNKISIGTNISPVIAYRSIQNTGSNFYDLANASRNSLAGNSLESDKSYFNTIESPRLTYTGGFGIDYSVSHRITISSGINLSNYGYNSMEIFVSEDNNALNNKIINSSAGDILVEESRGSLQDDLGKTFMLSQSSYGSALFLSQEKMNVNLSFIEIPLSIKYYFGGTSQKIYVNTGIAPSFLASGSAELKSQQIKLGKIDAVKSYNTVGFAGIGYSSFIFNNKFRFCIEPRLRYMLNPVSKIDYIRNYPYSFSLTTGLFYTF